MYSKGIYKRHVNHPILQDGFRLILEIHQRRWQCSNPNCKDIETDHFSFVDKRRRNTNVSDYLIVQAFRDHTASAAGIAKRFSVSDTHAITTFSRNVDMPRRQLPEIIDLYRSSRFKMFRDISCTLEEFFEPIIHSFVLVKRLDKKGAHMSRLSNGPIEALNRIPKDTRRIGRGYRNFLYLRNRFLFSQRKNAAILATPKPLDEVLLKNIRPIKKIHV